MKLIIRDDDTNFFTKPQDIQKAYSEIPSFPVSFAIVPMVVDVIGGCPETKGNETPCWVGDNEELSSYLRERASSIKPWTASDASKSHGCMA